jgi:pimeloyl-ACP methyl ester carboxylesterase
MVRQLYKTNQKLRWTKQILLGIGCFVVLAALVGAGFETFMRWQTSHRYPVSGQLVDIGGRKIQIDCRGKGSPTVVLESGLDTLGSLSWATVHDAIAQTTRICAYSRAGILWSDPSPDAFDSKKVAQDLHTALTKAGETTPWVMVGHSLGGPYIMMFTSLYNSEVAGLVFVDASHPDQVAPLRKITGTSLEAQLSSFIPLAEILARIGVVRLVSMANTHPNVPPFVNQVDQAYLAQNIGSFLKEVQSSSTAISAAGHFRQLGDRPLVVLTAAKKLSSDELQKMRMNQEQEMQMQALWKQLQADQTTWSTHSRHEIVPDASHYIQLDRPDAVIKAVREVVIDARKIKGKRQ